VGILIAITVIAAELLLNYQHILNVLPIFLNVVPEKLVETLILWGLVTVCMIAAFYPSYVAIYYRFNTRYHSDTTDSILVIAFLVGLFDFFIPIMVVTMPPPNGATFPWWGWLPAVSITIILLGFYVYDNISVRACRFLYKKREA
jgi:hypothetical protein